MNTLNLNPDKSIFAPVQKGDDYRILCEHEFYHVIEAHPYQRLREAESGLLDNFDIIEEGNEMECQCDECGTIFWYTQVRYTRE